MNLTRELSAISGNQCGVAPEFGLIDTHLDRPVEPHPPEFAADFLIRELAARARSPSVDIGMQGDAIVWLATL